VVAVSFVVEHRQGEAVRGDEPVDHVEERDGCSHADTTRMAEFDIKRGGSLKGAV
jgi:hypothetical protein